MTMHSIDSATLVNCIDPLHTHKRSLNLTSTNTRTRSNFGNTIAAERCVLTLHVSLVTLVKFHSKIFLSTRSYESCVDMCRHTSPARITPNSFDGEKSASSYPVPSSSPSSSSLVVSSVRSSLLLSLRS